MTLRDLLPVALAVIAAFATPAWAGSDRVPPVADPLVRAECGACHMAFPPALLPARSWERMMGGLADHFGEDASLPSDKAASINAYLVGRAGDNERAGLAAKFMRRIAPADAPLRITTNPAFLRKHRFADSVWRDPKILTPSNCPACHLGADRGWFED